LHTMIPRLTCNCDFKSDIQSSDCAGGASGAA
jgi:hypothetical protein